jgi:hypothetical protein
LTAAAAREKRGSGIGAFLDQPVIETVPVDAPPLTLNVPSYLVPVHCALIEPIAGPVVHAIVRATLAGVMVPSTVTTGVPGDHVS